jgi:hypothetical protein
VKSPVEVRSGYTRTLVLPSLTTAASYRAEMNPSWFEYLVQVAVRDAVEK